jgi:hypothetical protein
MPHSASDFDTSFYLDTTPPDHLPSRLSFSARSSTLLPVFFSPPAAMDQVWPRRPFDRTPADYKARIQHLEDVVHLLLARQEPALFPVSSLAPLAGLFQYSVDRGLVPLLSKKTAKSLATNWQNKKLQRGSLIRLPSQCLPFFQPAMSSVGLDITVDQYPGLHPPSTRSPMHSLGMSTVASVPAALAHSISCRPHTSPLSTSMAGLPTHSNSFFFSSPFPSLLLS